MGNKSNSKHDRNQMCGPPRNCEDGEQSMGGGRLVRTRDKNHPGLKREKKMESYLTGNKATEGVRNVRQTGGRAARKMARTRLISSPKSPCLI